MSFGVLKVPFPQIHNNYHGLPVSVLFAVEKNKEKRKGYMKQLLFADSRHEASAEMVVGGQGAVPATSHWGKSLEDHAL